MLTYIPLFATSSHSITRTAPLHFPCLNQSAFSSVLGRGMKSSFSSGMARMSQLPGYRFHPTDEELVNHFLKLKNQGQDDAVRTIAVVSICKYEPCGLPALSQIKCNDRVWYFFSPRDYKYKKSKRSNRTTEKGYWKPTGKLGKVMDKRKKKQIGTKRTLVFYDGRPKGTRTGWIMQEYECAPDSNSKLHDQGNFVLYKLKKKTDEKTSKGEPNQCTAVVASDLQNQDPSTMIANSVHQQPYHMTYDVEDECLNEVNATSNDETSLPILSSFENQTSVPGEYTPLTVIPSGFEFQSPHKKGGCLMTSNLENQITTYEEGECPLMLTPSESNQTQLFDSDFENQISPYVKGDSLLISSCSSQISVCGDDELSPPVICSDFKGKSPYDTGDCLLTSDLEVPLWDNDLECLLSPPYRLPPDFEDQSMYEKDDCLKTSDLEIPISDTEFEELEQNYPITPPSCLEGQSTFYKGEPNGQLAYDCRKISSDDKASISVSEKGESSSFKETPSDFANQNQIQKTDMQNRDFDWDLPIDVESVLAMDWEPMVIPAAETQCTLNSKFQGSMFTDEIPPPPPPTVVSSNTMCK